MTTLPAPLSADQQLAISVHRAIGSEPIFDATDEQCEEIAKRLGPAPFDPDTFTASAHGIAFNLVDEVARVDDVGEFLWFYGLPCTHERARQIVFFLPGCDEFQVAWDEAVAQARFDAKTDRYDGWSDGEGY